jgi:hypothetical protein
VAELGSVQVELIEIAAPEPGVCLTLSGLGPLASQLALRGRDAEPFDPDVEARGVETLDPALAHRYFFHGDEALVRAVLSPEVRERLQPGPPDDMVRRLTLLDGQLHAEVREGDLDELTEILGRLLDVTRELSSSESVPDRLARHVLSDPRPDVRRADLALLHNHYPEHPGTVRAVREACSDPDPEVRLDAGGFRGEEGREVVREVALNPEVNAGTAIRGLEMLGDDLEVAEGVQFLEETLAGLEYGTAEELKEGAPDLGHLALTLIDLLGRKGGAEVLEALSRVLDHEDPEMAMAAATALGRTGDPAAEEPLIRALERDSPLFRATVATALGRVGTARAVGPLRGGGRIYNRAFQSAARQAIAEIQSRLTGATPGQLALADGDTGQLTLAEEDVEGRVSMASEAEAEESTDPDDQTQWRTDRTVEQAEEGGDSPRDVHPSSRRPPRLDE